MQNITEDFDKIEKQINTPEKYDNERLTLEENILKQKVRIFLLTLSPKRSLKTYRFCSVIDATLFRQQIKKVFFFLFFIQRLMEDLDSYDEPINQVRDTTSNLLEKQLVDRQTFSAIQKKTGALSERQKQMKNACRENGDK